MNLHKLKLDERQRQALEKLLQGNSELREQLLSPQASTHDRALQVLSIVRAFDRPMYESVCRGADPTLPIFDELTASPDVLRVPRTEDTFWLREGVQNYWLSYWKEHTDEYLPWAQRFAGWLENNNKDPAERLALLLRVDVTQALRLLKTEFEKANAADDLSLCHSLSQQVEGSLASIDPSLRPEFAAIAARYRGRAQFLREFQRTVSYFPRRVPERAFKELIEGTDRSKWILYLSAPGGMGKTIFVQRMIAHKLLKEAPFPLVAHVDLDDVEVPEIAKAPWLVAIEIAEELDEQLTTRIFSDQFLSEVSRFSPLLYRRESDRGRTLTDDERYELRALAYDQFSHWAGFVSRCMELSKDRPLVIFIDTIEEASLHWPDQFRLLLERFEELHAAVPQLRLVLSGRYPPSSPNTPPQNAHFIQYGDSLKRQTLFVQLEPLSPPEDAAFIRAQLPDVGDKLINVMTSAAAGNPFKLSMLCETVSKNREMTAEKLAEYGSDVDLAYLIKRIIERLPLDEELGLRWVLRYGAIPRRLTLSFLQDVLHPLLIEALSGRIEEAREDIPTPKERATWLQRKDEKLDPGHLWEQLSRYASDRSWISLQSRDPYTATLHPDVANPMRALLKKQPIFRRIHREAVSHFARLRANEPARWVELTLAELYHRVELGEDDIHAALVGALDERASVDDAAARLEVLREFVKPEGDFSRAPRGALARAHYEIADAIAVLANFDYLPQGSRREDIRANLQKAFDLNRSADIQLPPFAFKWRDFLDRNIPSPWSVLADLLFVLKSAECRARYWLLLADIFGQRKISSFGFSLLATFAGLSDGRVASAHIPNWAIMERVAYAYRQRGSHRSAENYLRWGYRAAPSGEGHAARIQTRLIELLVESARLRDAETEMNKVDAAGIDLGEDLRPLRIEIALLRRNAWTALSLTEGMSDKTGFRFHLFRGRALAQLQRIDEASKAFAEAAQAVLRSESPTLLDEIRREELIFRLFEAGLPTEPANPRSSSVGTAAELELIRAFQVRDNQAECSKIIHELTQVRHTPATRIRATIAGVTWGILPSERFDDAFIRMLDGVGVKAMRRALLEAPVLLAQTQPWGLGWFKRFELRSSLKNDIGSPIEMMDWVRYGRVLLAMGDRKRADAAFANIATRMGADGAELAVYRQRCLGDPEAQPQAVEFWNGLFSEPGLYATTLLENAERAMRIGDLAVVGKSLARVAAVLKKNALHPIFAERHRKITAAFEQADRATPASADADVQEGTGQTEPTLAQFRCCLVTIDAERFVVETPGREVHRFSTAENESLSILARYTRDRSPIRLIPHLVNRWPEPLDELKEPLIDLEPQAASESDLFFLALTGAPMVATPWEMSVPSSSVPIRIGNGRDEGPIADEIRQPERGHRAARFISNLTRQSWSGATIGAYRVPYKPSPTMISQMTLLDDRLMASHLHIDTSDPAQADIIYIMTDIDESRSLPEPCFPGGMTAELLGREFQRVRSDGSKPFVVLHSPILHGITSGIEQLFARNRLSQALVNSGAVSAVLATSLASSPENTFPQDALLDALRRATNEPDVLRLLRASAIYPAAVTQLEATLGIPATALFLNVETGFQQ